MATTDAAESVSCARTGPLESLAPRLRTRRRLARRWRILIGFALGLILLDVAVWAASDVWRRHDPHDYRDRLLAARARTWDCVVVGGSPVSEGIDPVMLEGTSWRGTPLTRVFNLGLPGGTTTDVWHATRNGLGAPPRLLVYGITASDLNDARNEDQGPRRLMTSADVLAWWSHRPKSAWWCARHYVRGRIEQSWQLYEHRRGLGLWLARQWPGFAPEAAALAEKNVRFSDRVVANRGFAPREAWRRQRLDLRKANGRALPPFPFLGGFRLGGHLRYLERLVDWADERGTTVVLVDMPVTAELETVRHRVVFESYRAAVAELAARRGIVVLDGSRNAVGLTEAHFADLIHLNAAGTRRFTAWLRRELSKMGVEERVEGRHAGGGGR